MPDLHVYRALTESEAVRFTKMGQILTPHIPFSPSPPAARAMRPVPADRGILYISALYKPDYFNVLLDMGGRWRQYFPAMFVPGTDLDVRVLSLEEADHEYQQDLFAATAFPRFFERVRPRDVR